MAGPTFADSCAYADLWLDLRLQILVPLQTHGRTYVCRFMCLLRPMVGPTFANSCAYAAALAEPNLARQLRQRGRNSTTTSLRSVINTLE